MPAAVVAAPQRAPRRARYLIPLGTPRRRELLAALAVLGVLGGLLFAPVTLGLAVAFHAVGKVTRWRPVWLAVPAVCGVVWVLAIGPAAALAGFLAAPRAVVALLTGVTIAPARLAHLGTASTGSVRWFPGQFPIALILAAGVAAVAWWLDWLHTDEWRLPAARPGLVSLCHRRFTAAFVRSGGVLTRSGACLGVDAGTGRPAAVPWRAAERGVLVTGSVPPAVAASGFQLAHAAIRLRKPVIVVDLAADGGLAGSLAAVCAATGAPLQVFGAAGSGYYEPLRDGDPARRAALVMGMLDWERAPDSARLGCQACLTDVFAVAAAAPADPGVAMLDDVAGLLRPGALAARMERVPPYHPRRLLLAGQVVMTADMLASGGSMAAFMADQLAGLRASPLGRWLGPAPAAGPGLAISVAEVVRTRGVALFPLDRAAHGRAADTIANLVAQDAAGVYAGRHRAAIGGDGLAWFGHCETVDPQALAGLAGAGTGLATVLSTTAAAAAGWLADQVSVLVLHRLDDHALAGRLAWLTGQRLVAAGPGSVGPAQAATGWPEPGGAPGDAGGGPAGPPRPPGLPGPAAVTGGPPFRAGRVYLGWQYAVAHPDPGPPPRRPVPPGPEELNPGWLAAQRREERLLTRYWKVLAGGSLAATALVLALGRSGLLNPALTVAGAAALVVLVGLGARVIWRVRRDLHATVAAEVRRVGAARADHEGQQFGRLEDHARRFRSWQACQQMFARQPLWYPVALPDGIDRVDVAGGTLAGCMGISPLVWLLPGDLPRLDLGVGMPAEPLADVLAASASADRPAGGGSDPARDHAIVARVIGALGEGAGIATVTAGLRALAQVGDPRDDIEAGRLTAAQLERVTGLFGRGAADRVVIERAMALEARLRALDRLGSEPSPLPRSALRVIALDRGGTTYGNAMLGTYVAVSLTHLLRQAPPGRPWRHTLCLAGVDRLGGEVLDRLCDACESTRTGLVLTYRSIPAQVRERLGRGNAAVAFMRLGNAEDARVAAEQIGTEHRFVLSQLTDTVGASVTGTSGWSYTSTVGTADSASVSASTSQTTGRSRGRGHTQADIAPFGARTASGSREVSASSGTSDSESITEGINASTSWGWSTSEAIGMNESLASTTQRSREFLIEPHQLQQLPPSAVIVSYASRRGRQVVLADANPAILALPTVSPLGLDEARQAQAAGPTSQALGEQAGEPPAGAARQWAPGAAP